MNLFKNFDEQHICSKFSVQNLKLEFKIYYYHLFINI